MAENLEPQEEEILEEEQEEQQEEDAGFFGSLQDQFGAAPWWIISFVFHGLLLLLLGLLSMVVMRSQSEETVITTDLAKSKPPEYDEKKPRDVFKNPVETPDKENPVEHPIIPHEKVEDTTHNETEDDMDTHTARGDPNAISDLPLGGLGVNAAIGLGGGGAGAFGQRNGGGKKRALMAGGGGKATESAVEAALRWLARHQEEDGHWDSMKYGASSKCDTAMTGLAVLAFLGAGHTEKAGKYRDNVQRGVYWLISKQNNEGRVLAEGDGPIGYNHSIAGLALAEAAGMARVPDTVRAAQAAVDYSVNIHQDPGAGGSDKKGWRYNPKQPGDISVSGWFIMQLKSAKIAGLKVDPSGFQGAINFLDSVEVEKANPNEPYSGHRYGYQPGRVLSKHRNTAMGVLGRMFLGWKREDLQGGVEYMIKEGGVPNWGSVDMYYWYYATIVCFQQGGEIWKKWKEAMIPTLRDNQRHDGDEDGSWDPAGAFGDRWGRVGSTALGCLCVEVYYRYMPMYE